MAKSALIAELGHLVSESRNSDTMQIDLMSSRQILDAMNAQDRGVPAAVEKVLPETAIAVDRIVEAFKAGGRLIYMGAGTSGRLGVLDASECPPTFGVPQGMVVGLIAGGDRALRFPIEGAEDSPDEGRQDLQRVNLTENDVVVGIAVSGRTPYVIGGLNYASQVGATTVALSCNPDSAIARLADIAISPVVGPEAVTGSTRLKSGTAQKLILNMLTTASMIRMGKTYQNLMVDLSVSNQKLAARATRILVEATGCTPDQAEHYLELSEYNVKLAILMALTGM
ncbi:N-acetylmuramic acid 6-phosphate etherase, partial [Devosia sp. J2-20]|uniref:N-acetylmuramic acid 6-phosphate etherase n=1 Tax=Devosia sp. J2-20 TaxID=3026161 RepID=UPI00249AE906